MMNLEQRKKWTQKFQQLSSAMLIIFAIFVIAKIEKVESREIARKAETTIQHEDQDGGDLISLQILFRHGDRTPYMRFRNDPYSDFDWPEGLGRLVNRGKDRMYRYGRALRTRYQDYVGDMYTKNIIAESSPILRCIGSNAALLAGLFPPENDQQIWSHATRYPESVLSRLWQPIPVTSVGENASWKLNPDCPCAAAQEIESRMPTEVPELRKFIADNSELMSAISNATGDPELAPGKTWLNFGYLYDTLFTERLYFGAERYQAPAWLNQVAPDTWERLRAFNDMVFSIYGQVPSFLRLRTGAFFADIIKNFRNDAKSANLPGETAALENRAKSKKLYTYGSHDTMIAYILNALGLYKEQPTFGSGLIFELRRPKSSAASLATAEPTVHLWYANVTNNNDIYRLDLSRSKQFENRCKQSYCALSDFAASLEAFVVNDIEKECGSGSNKSATK